MKNDVGRYIQDNLEKHKLTCNGVYKFYVHPNRDVDILGAESDVMYRELSNTYRVYEKTLVEVSCNVR